MSYDSWKLDNGVDTRADHLADLCSDAEHSLVFELSRAMNQANLSSVAQWDTREVLAEAEDDGEIRVELTMRLSNLPADARGGNLLDLAEAFTSLGDQLAKLARCKQSGQTAVGLKMAPSAQSRFTGRQADLG